MDKFVTVECIKCPGVDRMYTFETQVMAMVLIVVEASQIVNSMKTAQPGHNWPTTADNFLQLKGLLEVANCMKMSTPSVEGALEQKYCKWNRKRFDTIQRFLDILITELASYERLGTALLVYGKVCFCFQSFFLHITVSHECCVSFASLAVLLIGFAYT